MTNLDARIGQLREQMEEAYLRGDKESALTLSRRLDTLIALAQRADRGGVFSSANRNEVTGVPYILRK